MIECSQLIACLVIWILEGKFFESASHVKESLLLYNVVDTLSNIFLNDTQKTFANKDCFKMLIQPLVDQVNKAVKFE